MYRLASLILLIASVVLGIASRIFPLGNILWDKYLGDVVYASVFYFALCIILGYKPVRLKTLITAGYVVFIEFFQLTPIPRFLNHSSNTIVKLFAYLVLGSTFSWWDLVAYAIGIGLAVICDRAISRICAKSESRS